MENLTYVVLLNPKNNTITHEPFDGTQHTERQIQALLGVTDYDKHDLHESFKLFTHTPQQRSETENIDVQGFVVNSEFHFGRGVVLIENDHTHYTGLTEDQAETFTQFLRTITDFVNINLVKTK